MRSFSLRHSCFWMVGLFCIATGIMADAAPPAWWNSGNPPVVTGGAENNHGAANIGQAKYMAKQALAALAVVDASTASAVEADLVGTGKPIPSWAAPTTQAQKDAQHAPLLIGQLKAIAAPFYTHLHTTAPNWLEGELVANQTKDTANSANYFPWTSSTADDENKAPRHHRAVEGRIFLGLSIPLLG